ncbi:hypothetical protein ColLi_01778 [Colletotrichum liriopes]|uniref:O-methyltransferase domain-containing protein n=1 Tax=Colletotrichum liriopes TaxID=708192 RepID=A0AA37LNC3_9PEZI|nr:hypothetical protein ColLi_01778 [Colletotrichum liriopes]
MIKLPLVHRVCHTLSNALIGLRFPKVRTSSTRWLSWSACSSSSCQISTSQVYFATAQTAIDADSSIDPAVKSHIQFMSSDILKPQAVSDAHVYLLRMTIHDWSD